jgi:hypothetical protein
MRPGDQGCDRRERFGRIEIEIGKQYGIIRNIRADHEQGVAVGRRRGDGFGADGGAAARPVLDDHVLADSILKVPGDDASESVDRPARGERHDQLDGLGRVILCGGGAGGHHAGEHSRAERPIHSHRRLLARSVLLYRCTVTVPLSGWGSNGRAAGDGSLEPLCRKS